MSRIQDAIEDAFRDGVNSAKAAGALPPMSIRDWFAGQAMAAMVAAAEHWAPASPDNMEGTSFISGAAYELADAMLKERAK